MKSFEDASSIYDRTVRWRLIDRSLRLGGRSILKDDRRNRLIVADIDTIVADKIE